MGLGSKEGVGAWMISSPSPVLKKVLIYWSIHFYKWVKYIRHWDSPISVFQGKFRIFAAVQLGEEGKVRL